MSHTGSDRDTTAFNLLFVCTGNTCRSPMAEAIARRAVEERGWSHVEVRSAGISAAAGAPAAEEACAIAREHGLRLERHESQPLTPALADWADLILVMTPSHLPAVQEMDVGAKVALTTGFGEDDGSGRPITDPIGGGREVYRQTYAQLERAIERVLDRIGTIIAP